MHNLIISFLLILFLSACGTNDTFLPGGDARENPPEPSKRVKKNLEEGKGFRLDTAMKGSLGGKGGTFEFASSNELWRASLDVIDFIPLTSANYSGGIIITDWYSEDQENFIKITLRFLTNEIRSDAIDIKIFYKKCDSNMKCKMVEKEDKLKEELRAQILKKATIYEKQNKDKNFVPYKGNNLKK